MRTLICTAILFLIFTLSILTRVLSQQPPQPLYHACAHKTGNFTGNSTYQSNLENLLTSIYTDTDTDNGFYNSSYGDQGADKAYAIALCRPDINPETCRACIRNSTEALQSLCPNFKEAIGGYDDCMLRYSNRSILNELEEGPYFWVYNVHNLSSSSVSGFNQSLFTLLGSLNDKAARGGSRYKFGADQISTPDGETIYALVQCTPDLSETQCRSCLGSATALIPQCCTARVGGRVIFPSCNFRYEVGPFYGTLPGPSPSLSPSPAPAGEPEPAKPTNSAVRIGKEMKAAPIVVALGFAVLLF